MVVIYRKWDGIGDRAPPGQAICRGFRDNDAMWTWEGVGDGGTAHVVTGAVTSLCNVIVCVCFRDFTFVHGLSFYSGISSVFSAPTGACSTRQYKT